MVCVYKLEWVHGTVNANIWRPKGNNYSKTKALKPSITHFSN